jgi:hypothetical protein
LTAALMFTGSAAAATVVGSNCPAATSDGLSIVSLKNPLGDPMPSAIPSAGVITSWTFNLGVVLSPGEFQVSEKLSVFAPTGLPQQLKVIGEAGPVPIQTGVTASPTRIPVQSGDLLGSTAIVSDSNGTEQGGIFCATKNAGDEVARIPVDPVLGSTVSTATTETGFQNPVTVSVEPDADGDGYGDETQDQCPTDASTQGPCPAPKVAPAPPAPPAPITLSASAAAKGGLATVTLTASAQATVTVGGSVALGKGKAAALSGGTQIVAPGTLAKFTVVFPAKLKAALKRLPPSKKLTLSLAASAPGANTKDFTVKVGGGKKPVHSRRKHLS